MPVNPDTPIPMLLRELESSTAWQILVQRLERIMENQERHVRNLPPTTDPREIQRLLGFVQGIERVIKEPKALQLEWEREFKKANPKTEGSP